MPHDARPGPGDPVRVAMTTWGERPHWEFAGRFLGRDAHGDWLGFPAGTRHTRPGATYVSEVGSVTLVPREGWYLATFHAPGGWCSLYADVATPAAWDLAAAVPVLRSTDLDLDVVVAASGRVRIDDEDEFAERRARLGYPAEVVAAARRWCAAVHRDVLAGRPPFDLGETGTAAAWLAVLRPPPRSPGPPGPGAGSGS